MIAAVGVITVTEMSGVVAVGGGGAIIIALIATTMDAIFRRTGTTGMTVGGAESHYVT